MHNVYGDRYNVWAVCVRHRRSERLSSCVEKKSSCYSAEIANDPSCASGSRATYYLKHIRSQNVHTGRAKYKRLSSSNPQVPQALITSCKELAIVFFHSHIFHDDPEDEGPEKPLVKLVHALLMKPPELYWSCSDSRRALMRSSDRFAVVRPSYLICSDC